MRSRLDGSFTVFQSAEQIGLTTGDNVDAIDVGAARAIDRGEECVDGFCDCNTNGIADACDLARDFSVDEDPVDDAPDGCKGPCLVSSRPQLLQIPRSSDGLPIGLVGNRMIQINAGDAGQTQAVRVTFVDLPAPFNVWSDPQTAMWVTEP